jgi:hypothetical protein
MIRLTWASDTNFKMKIEHLLGKEVPLTTAEINSLAHLTTGDEWIIKVLHKLGLTIDDIIHEGDRKILMDEVAKNNWV